jgi:hypothetical protein
MLSLRFIKYRCNAYGNYVKKQIGLILGINFCLMVHSSAGNWHLNVALLHATLSKTIFEVTCQREHQFQDYNRHC